MQRNIVNCLLFDMFLPLLHISDFSMKVFISKVYTRNGSVFLSITFVSGESDIILFILCPCDLLEILLVILLEGYINFEINSASSTMPWDILGAIVFFSCSLVCCHHFCKKRFSSTVVLVIKEVV